MTSIKTVFRSSTKGGKHQGSLSLRIIHQRKTKLVVISNCNIYPEEWNSAEQCIVYPVGLSERRTYLRQMSLRIEKERATLYYYIKQLERYGSFEFGDIFKYYRRGQTGGALLIPYTECVARIMEERSQERTARAYLGSVRQLVYFNKGHDIPLSKFDTGLIKKFETWLKDTGRTPNTIAYYMRNLRAVYNRALAEKMIEADLEHPFDAVLTSPQKTVKRALSVEDMRKIYILDFACCDEERTQAFNMTKRIFLFSFYSRGMCFVDIAYLQKKNIQDGAIRYYRKKTGKMIEVRISIEMQAIIDSFAEETCDSPYLFPIIKPDCGLKERHQYENALRTTNARLLQIAKMADIDTRVTMHVARHSWASIGKLAKLPISLISEGLGHSSEKVTSIYLASFDSTALDDANNLVAQMVTSPNKKS